MPETEAYCPECEEELTKDEYSYESGCGTCGCLDLFLGQEAFLDFAEKEMDLNVPN
jgi:Zn finger protein HypA/HybF involved in hydrogenase expression